MNKSNATLIGFSAIALWGALALLTRLTDNQIPPFQLMSMTFAIAFLMMLTKGRKRVIGVSATPSRKSVFGC